MQGPKEGFGRPMSYMYTFPSTPFADATAPRLYGHRSFGAFGNAATVATTNGGADDVFNNMGVRLKKDDGTCSPSYMAITVFPKSSGSSAVSGALSMKLVDSAEGQDTSRPYRGPPCIPPNKTWNSALNLAVSAGAAAALISTMI